MEIVIITIYPWKYETPEDGEWKKRWLVKERKGRRSKEGPSKGGATRLFNYLCFKEEGK